MKNRQGYTQLKIFHRLGDHDGTLQIKYDDTSMKTKLISTRFGGTFGTLNSYEKSFLMLY